MAWKKDNEGHFIADGNGNPVYVSDMGEDIPVDYPAVSRKLREASAESRNRKEKLRQYEEKLAHFDGIEDLGAWAQEAREALEFRKNAPEKDKDIKAQVDAQIEARTASLRAQLGERDKKLAEKEKEIAAITAKLNKLVIQEDVRGSRLLRERVSPEIAAFIEREMIRAGSVDETGKAYYRYEDGEAIFGDAGNASIDEAIPLFLKKMGKDPAKFILSQDLSKGAGGLPNPGNAGGAIRNPWKKETWNLTIGAIASQIADYWSGVLTRRTLASLRGLMAADLASSDPCHAVDITGENLHDAQISAIIGVKSA